MQGLRDISPPVPTPGYEPFWDAARDGVLLYGHCNSCGRAHYYPRQHCPFCHGSDVEWHPASGRGKIYACTVLRRAKPPYALAYVQLEEGPAMLTNILAPSLDAVQIGMDVRVTFHEGVPMFTPAEVTS